MPLIWALLGGAAPHKHALAEAVEGYLAGSPEAVAKLEALHEARPLDDDVAYWLAVARIEAGACDAGVELLSGRSGAAQPTGRLRAWEGLGRLCSGDEDAGVSLLVQAFPTLPAGDLLGPRVAAELGVRLPVEEAGGWLRAAGGDPGAVLGQTSTRLAVAPAELPSFAFRQGGTWWRHDPATGVSLPTEEPAAQACPSLESGAVRASCGPEGRLVEVLDGEATAVRYEPLDGPAVRIEGPAGLGHPRW